MHHEVVGEPPDRGMLVGADVNLVELAGFEGRVNELVSSMGGYPLRQRLFALHDVTASKSYSEGMEFLLVVGQAGV